MKTIFVMLLISSAVFSQRFDIQSGNLISLKGIKDYNVTFDYSEIRVHGYQTEEDFLKDKMKKREEKGRDEEFKAEWFESRSRLYEPAFINYFNKSFKKGEIKAGVNPEAKYTMNVKTLWIYPGYNAGTAIEPAKITALITVTETLNPRNVLVAVLFEKSIGLEHELGNTMGERISWAYEKLAKNLSMQLKRFL